MTARGPESVSLDPRTIMEESQDLLPAVAKI